MLLRTARMWPAQPAQPEVEFVGDYSKASYSYPIVDEAVQARTRLSLYLYG